nr:hypothetical protein [Candidatus Woesearchaeota archaeon]
MNGIGGIFGIYGHPEAAKLTYLGLYAMNHRGQDGAVIISSDRENNYIQGGLGLVKDVFDEDKLGNLRGNIAVGAVYYSLDLINELYEKKRSLVFSLGNLEERVYSSIGIKNSSLICEIDSFGVFPMVIGVKEQAKIISSESCSLNIVDAKYVGNMLRGIEASIGEKISHRKKMKRENRTCLYEVVYGLRPDSRIYGRAAGVLREKIGALLGNEELNGITVPVPDSGNFFAAGHSDYSGNPIRFGLIRNPYVDSNITGTANKGDLRVKYNVNAEVVKDKDVFLCDDSILTGETLRKIIFMLKKQGARTVNVRTGPRVIEKCPYGTNLVMEMIAGNKNDEQIKVYIGADSLKMADLNEVKKIIGDDFCDYCMTGNKIP